MARETWQRWLRCCLRDPTNPARIALAQDGLTSLRALTGQDKRALDAMSACWELYSTSEDYAQTAALMAVRCLVVGLRPRCRPFARELIAFSLDWPDRDRLWPLAYPDRERRG